MRSVDQQPRRSSGLDWVGPIPADWSVRRIKDIAHLQSGDAIASEEISPEGEYPVFGGNGLRGYTGSFTHEGQYVLIGRQGALCGNINYASGQFWATEHAVVATLRDGFDVRWFGELLRTMNLNQYSNAAAQPGLSVDRIKFLGIPVPPKSEQQLIGRHLAACFAAIDAAVAAKREQLARLDAVRETTIEKAVTHGLDPKVRLAKIGQDWIESLPAHWQHVRIKRLLSRMDYGLSESTERDGLHPVLKMGNIQGGEIRFTNIEFVESVEEGLILETDDILYNRTNSSDQVGKAAIFRGSKADGVTFASYLVRLRVNHRILPAFLNYAVNSSGFLSFARKLAIPSVQQSNLNSTRYGGIFVPVPPRTEQLEICAYLEAQLAQLKDIASTIQAQINTLTAYRKSLVHEYVTGQQRVPVEQAEKAVAYG